MFNETKIKEKRKKHMEQGYLPTDIKELMPNIR